MNISAEEILDQQKYQIFVDSQVGNPHLVFYHAWEWGVFLESIGNQIMRLGIYQDDQLIGTALFVKNKLHLGDFWYCPRGILLDYNNHSLALKQYHAVIDYFKAKIKTSFVRFDPNIIKNTADVELFTKIGTRSAASFTQVERCWIVDIQPSAEKQVAWMRAHDGRKNIFYSVKKGISKGVTVTSDTSNEYLDLFYESLVTLNTRKGNFGIRPKSYYQNQFGAMSVQGYQRIFVCWHEGEILATAYIAIFNDEASYLHGASTMNKRELSGSHILHMAIIDYLRDNHPNVKKYNFWGVISPKNYHPKHPKYGYSFFKKSFGGYQVEYLRAQDFVFDFKAWKMAYFIDKYRVYKTKND